MNMFAKTTLRRIAYLALSILLFGIISLAHADEPTASGEVKLPLDRFTQLSDAARIPPKAPRKVPADYASGNATVNISVREEESRATAHVSATLTVKVLEDDWVLVPLLPAGTSVQSVTVAGSNVELINGPLGLSWGVKQSGVYQVALNYGVDALRSEGGYAAGIPLPLASSTTLRATLPGEGLDVTLIPSAGSKSESAGGTTALTATVPSVPGVQLSWRTPSKLDYSMSRAQYSGKISGESVHWTGELQVEIFNDETATLNILPESVTLGDIKVDGKPAPIVIQDSQFSTPIKGRGPHKLTVEFQVPIGKQGGPPQINLPIRPIPVTRIDLSLPGKKELQLVPKANVTYQYTGGETAATAYVPMSDSVRISWSEAVPEETKSELRADATVYHAVHAEEGLLAVHAMVNVDISRGETNRLELEVPKGVDVNRVVSPAGIIADWRYTKSGEQGIDRIEIFFDRQVGEPINLDVHYDQALDKAQQASGIKLPLLSAGGVRRQRGMIALLASKELSLKPMEEKEVTRVGENQLPAEVRESIKMTVAHTYKYVDGSPSLRVQTAAPEKAQGRFDAVINTLVSLSDVSLKGSAQIEINVKSGSIGDLEIEAPSKVNVLSLTAPSLRTYKVRSEADKQIIDVQFTQDMEGQFRAEVNYEFIMENEKSDIKVPTLLVKGAEVEQGRIAVEALSAVEVQPAASVSLSSLDLSELPQQLILKTTNPILLGYKYVKVEPAYELRLKITRHKEIDTQSATIDLASYRTLYTRDGLAVTTAEFRVRNTHNQFLRLALPEGSKVWSATVGGSAEKPALAEAAGESSRAEVLIKIISSSQGFPVTITYQTPVPRIQSFGTVRGILPKPDMVVTKSEWHVFLPDEVGYWGPRTNMRIVTSNQIVSPQHIQNEMASGDSSGSAPLNLPTSGVRFTFEKLYANQSAEDAYFSIPYGSTVATNFAQILAVVAAVLMVAAAAGALGLIKGSAVRFAPVAFAVGALFLGVSAYFGLSLKPALITAILCLIGAAAYSSRKRSEKEAIRSSEAGGE